MSTTNISERGLETQLIRHMTGADDLRSASVEGVAKRGVLFGPLTALRHNALMGSHLLFELKTSA